MLDSGFSVIGTCIPDSKAPTALDSGFRMRKQNCAELRIRITLVTWDIFLFYLVHNNFRRTLQGSRTQSCFPCTVTYISRHFYMENFHKDSVWKVMNVSDVIVHKQLKTGFINWHWHHIIQLRLNNGNTITFLTWHTLYVVYDVWHHHIWKLSISFKHTQKKSQRFKNLHSGESVWKYTFSVTIYTGGKKSPFSKQTRIRVDVALVWVLVFINITKTQKRINK